MKPEITPGPYTSKPDPGMTFVASFGLGAYIMAPKGVEVGDVQKTADFFAHAANTHHKILAALEQAEFWLREEAESPEPGATRPDNILDELRDAIAIGKGHRFAVQMEIGSSWENVWGEYDEANNRVPMTFATREEAEKELCEVLENTPALMIEAFRIVIVEG